MKAPPTDETDPERTGSVAECFVPTKQTSFRINQVAELLSCTSQHIYNLVACGALVVPKENIERAKSGAGIMVPRQTLVAFLDSRSLTNGNARRREEGRAKSAAIASKVTIRGSATSRDSKLICKGVPAKCKGHAEIAT